MRSALELAKALGELRRLSRCMRRRIELMINEAIDLENAIAEVDAFRPNAVDQLFHRLRPAWTAPCQRCARARVICSR